MSDCFVFDTNSLISAAILPNTISRKSLDKAIDLGVIAVSDKTIEEVINDADEKGICLIDDKLISFREKNEYLYNRVKDVKFREFQIPACT